MSKDQFNVDGTLKGMRRYRPSSAQLTDNTPLVEARADEIPVEHQALTSGRIQVRGAVG